MPRFERRSQMAIWLGLIAWVSLLPFAWPSAADPLGATPHGDGPTTFRVWAPSVDGVGVRINDKPAVPLAHFGFNTSTPLDFSRATDPQISGIVQMYRDLIALRRNLQGATRGLTGQSLNVFHRDDSNKTLAYHRWDTGGAGDDVVVVANFANVPQPSLKIGFPRRGQWHVRFNSGAAVYDRDFINGDSFDTAATAGAKDGLNFNGNVEIGPYSVIILSQ